MRNVQDIFETTMQSFISAFSICMTVPLKELFDLRSTNITTTRASSTAALLYLSVCDKDVSVL